MHELAHNLKLQHASDQLTVSNPKTYCSYCDDSCSLGYCCKPRCYNAPHNWQLGWATPVLNLNSYNLGPGAWRTVVVPQERSTSVNFVRIVPDWLQGYWQWSGGLALFVAYRLPAASALDIVPSLSSKRECVWRWQGWRGRGI